MRIVIVEDEVRIREGIKKLLLKLDSSHEVVGEAEDGRQGLGIIIHEEPDLIITDVRMPFMDGLEMLDEAYRRNMKSKAIVLSAYSEFEYARTAIKLGVTEYLLKPIVVNDFTQAVDNVKQHIQKDKMQKPEQIGNMQQVFKNILNGELSLEKEVLEYLESRYEIKRDMPLGILSIYLPVWNESKVKWSKRYITQMMKERPVLKFCILEDQSQKIIHLIIYQFTNTQPIARWLQYYILQQRDELTEVSFGWVQSQNIYEMKQQYVNLCSYFDWNITLGDEIVISYPAITKVQTAVCIYPVEIENQMKIAICTSKGGTLNKVIEQFHNYFHQEKVYEPKKIKECYARFFWALISFSKEIGSINQEDLEQQVVMEQIMKVRTKIELKRITESLVEKINPQKVNSSMNVTVKRALAIIHEFYQTGITLEEIAAKLDITPEYLGTQFNRSMGMYFNTYIKNYRINKAKELLLGTQLKLYQIADKIGFSDPKYFSKVFKETTGYSPADYRKMHR